MPEERSNAVDQPLGGSKLAQTVDSIFGNGDPLHYPTFRKTMQERTRRTQERLKAAGFSTGGTPPFGYERWLVDSNKKRLRVLEEGEEVSMKGYHVMVLPTNKMQLSIMHRIAKMSQTKSAREIALNLEREEVPIPSRKGNQKAWTSRLVARVLHTLQQMKTYS